jgi:hypothetical protein
MKSPVVAQPFQRRDRAKPYEDPAA